MQTKIFYALGKKLRLTEQDIDQILHEMPSTDELPSFSFGPPFYGGGGRYGTFSIQVFFNKE